MTRSYSILSDDAARTDLQWVVEYDAGGVDIRGFWRGKAFDQKGLNSIRFMVNDNPRTDLLPNPLSLTIVSDRLLGILSPLVNQEEVQILGAPIYSEFTGQRVTGYHLVNPLRVLSALTPQCIASEPLITQFEVQVDKIPEHLHVFRLAKEEPALIVSNAITERLPEQELKGVCLIPIRGVY
ncbi:hypothetical protein J8F10_05345 [Gemmata sp. G18]|uniref:Uncharacterized protein n=1 Tax=Gemmata palustris TaxID=2822762 RepID=A0ABS5BLW9_9BACT|nr:hypothetical protein [Gemmata palustris]MBP3954708.1 hypothetical protein [Gemmata palustris]